MQIRIGVPAGLDDIIITPKRNPSRIESKGTSSEKKSLVTCEKDWVMIRAYPGKSYEISIAPKISNIHIEESSIKLTSNKRIVSPPSPSEGGAP